MALTDISHEKRRQALERIFFHDLLNTAGALLGYAQLLPRTVAADDAEAGEAIARLAGTLVEEIRAQRQLAAAENNDLRAHFEPLRSGSVMREVAELYRKHSAAYERQLMVDRMSADVEFASDRGLLTRVISNMVKNALEACDIGQGVTLGCRADDGQVEFWVHNPRPIPREVQLQIFRRSFSTKGYGRGLGTYSIKLLTERYLKGPRFLHHLARERDHLPRLLSAPTEVGCGLPHHSSQQLRKAMVWQATPYVSEPQ